ncbi:MAG: TetR/AcrR family transcriptional regulator [Deltaproteobacteria bacterium]|nr:TetR/AcrR family transcriptional regulator [Deltaproteobacteria bacterium]TLN02940.1 MAG: TetR/AcrR family transcriptional regulator [bacterium]
MIDKCLPKKEEFRRDILEAAREIFSLDGYGNFSMRKLARRIGYSPTTIYLYFKDKDEILFCLCEEFYDDLYQTILKIEAENFDLLTTLRKVLLAYVSFGLANPEQYRVAFFTNPSVYGSPAAYLENDTMSRRAYFHYRDLVAACCTAGILIGMDMDTLAQVLWAGVHGVVAAALHTRDFPLADPAVLVEVMVTGLLTGLEAGQTA